MRRAKVLNAVLGTYAALLFAAGSLSATVIRVPGDYPKLQLALDAASSGDTVQVAAGRYAPSTNGESFPIAMKNGVRLLGAGADACTLDAEGTEGVMYCYRIGDPATRIEGFLITNGHAGEGGGIHCYDHSQPTITKNIIIRNSALVGGGLDCKYYSDPVIESNVITENRGDSLGGGIACHRWSKPKVTSNIITENITDRYDGYGGGICCDWCVSNATIANNIIAGNYAGQHGGGISSVYSDPTITNNIITGNSAFFCGGGVYCHIGGQTTTITNNIITGNSADLVSGGCAGGGIYVEFAANATITYDDAWDNTPDDYSGHAVPGTGCISADPLFVDPSTGDYHSQRGSPCIDAGDNNAPALPGFDFDGKPRVMDGDGDGIAVVDMGAFEYEMLGALITGGGWIPGGPSGAQDKRTFGFNVHSEDGAVFGQLQFNDHGIGLRVHSDSLYTLVIQPGDTIANFAGDCRVAGVSGYTFDCEVMDRGEPGHGVDWFSIQICDGNGNPYYSGADFLGGGNIQIHREADDSLKGDFYDTEVDPDSLPNPPREFVKTPRVLAPADQPLSSSPNPFTNQTHIAYGIWHIAEATNAISHEPLAISLRVYDVSGRLVETLVDGLREPGIYQVEWDGSGQRSGVYFCRLTGGSSVDVKRMVLLR